MMNRAPGLFTECRHIVAQGGPQKFRILSPIRGHFVFPGTTAKIEAPPIEDPG